MKPKFRKMLYYINLFVLLSFCILLCSCNNAAPEKSRSPEIKDIPPEIILANSPFSPSNKAQKSEDGIWEIEYGNFPHMDGSTSLRELALNFAKTQLGLSYERAQAMINFTYKSYALEAFLNQTEFQYQNFFDSTQNIYFGPSPVNLLLVMGFSKNDSDYFASKGINVKNEIIAKDALVFVTHKDNPVESLTTKELKDILSGIKTNWSEFGGENSEIKLYNDFNEMQGEINYLLNSKILNGAKLTEAVQNEQYIPNGVEPGGEGYTISSPAAYENNKESLGLAFYSSVGKTENIKLLKIDDIEANAETILDNSYLLSLDCSAVFRDSDAENSPGKFAEWMHSESGKACIESAGFIHVPMILFPF